MSDAFSTDSKPMIDTCANCRWWRQEDETCHAAPPVRLPRKFDPVASAGNRVRLEALIWGWPVCAADDFCRVHERQRDPANHLPY